MTANSLENFTENEHWKNARNRTEKSERIRTALLQAAIEVVGEVGYADASIALITQKAGIGQGTFYNYFENRQEIFDELLPMLGKKMQLHVKNSASGGKNFAELEERGFRGFFSFLEKEPHFFRILNEAESFAPKGHQLHFDSVVDQYVKFLKNSYGQGEFSSYEAPEFEVIVFMLMAARSYLAMRYVHAKDGKQELPDWVTNAYMKFILYGLEGVPRTEGEQTKYTPTKKKNKPQDSG